MITEKDIEQIITSRLDDMPNYEEYMVNSTMKVLVVKDLSEQIKNHNYSTALEGLKEWESSDDFFSTPFHCWLQKRIIATKETP